MTEEKAKQAKARLIQDYLRVFNTESGQEVMKDLMQKGNFLQSCNAATDREYFINEGRRELIIYILSNLSYDVTSLMEFIDQSNNERRENKNEKPSNDDFDFFVD